VGAFAVFGSGFGVPVGCEGGADEVILIVLVKVAVPFTPSP